MAQLNKKNPDILNQTKFIAIPRAMVRYNKA
jgi:hypothetical protein